ncbi:MAG: methyltransferase domain-containing protein [Gammaproteobacteria bacterium]|nr:methyltransferase domain-containing protein [Gammaproteobacteria bacterium]
MTSSQKQINALKPADYAACAVLANEVGEQMLARLEWVTLDPSLIIDVGCGVGHCTRELQRRYPKAKVVGVDIAYPMLAFARQQAEPSEDSCDLARPILWASADAAMLPFPDRSVDLIFANLILPWCHDQEQMLREWRRILRPDGLLIFTSLGPDTLKIWRELLGDITIPNLIDMHDHGDALTKVRFADPVMDVDYFTLTYRQIESFFHELQATGMLVESEDSALMAEAKKNSSPAGFFEATYEVIFGHTWGPKEGVDHVADEFGTVRIPLAHLRRRG